MRGPRLQCKMRLCLSLAIMVMAPMVAAQPKDPGRDPMKNPRLGFVCLRFDDGRANQYTNAFRIMEKYGVKAGFFGVVAGKFADEPGEWHMTAQQAVEMYKAGHEISDHTFYHQAYVWGDITKKDEWVRRTEKSIAILRELGIEVRSWLGTPGGIGSGASRELVDLLSNYYECATLSDHYIGDGKSYCGGAFYWGFAGNPWLGGLAGGIGIDWEQYAGIPLSSSRQMTREQATKAIERMKTSAADTIQQGRINMFGWHDVVDENHGTYGLEEFCKWLSENRVPCKPYAYALETFRNKRKYFPEDVEQIPNPGFACDLDGDRRPDGWLECSYAGQGIKPQEGGKAAEFNSKTWTCLYGPESGRTRVRFLVRAPKENVQVTLKLSVQSADENYHGRWQGMPKTTIVAGPEWQELTTICEIPERACRVYIRFDMPEKARIHVASPSWRRIMGR